MISGNKDALLFFTQESHGDLGRLILSGSDLWFTVV